MSVTYSTEFISLIKENKLDSKFIINDWPKLSQAAEVHGYRGASKKKHNGIVPIRPTDKGLLKTLKKLSNNNNDNGLPIKVVAHCPSGNRLVGYKSPDNNITIYGVANYDD